jgi:hypothetical protein
LFLINHSEEKEEKRRKREEKNQTSRVRNGGVFSSPNLIALMRISKEKL